MSAVDFSLRTDAYATYNAAPLFAESLQEIVDLISTSKLVEGEITRTAEWADNPEPVSRWRDRIPTGRQTITFTLTIDTNETPET